ncbi:MAG: YitT family protein [Chloroflexota bacterium]
MFKPIHWQTFIRDFIVIQIGFALFGLSIALLIQANLGTSPWAILTVALAQISGLTPGILTVLIGLVVLTGAVILRERIGWGTISNILFIGPWLDLALWLIPSVTGKLSLQIIMFLSAVVLMGMATAIYISVDAGAGPRDSLMLALKRTRGWSVRRARVVIEVTVVFVGWLLGGPAGIGTVGFAMLIGPAVQWGFRLFKVQLHKSVESEAAV